MEREWYLQSDPLSNNQPTLMSVNLGIADGTPGYSWDAESSIPSTGVQNGMDVVGSQQLPSHLQQQVMLQLICGISAHSAKNPEAAMRVLNVLFTDQAAQIDCNKRLEGLEYELDENGQMMYPEGKTMADIGWPAAKSMAYWPNVTLCKTWNYEAEDIYDQMKKKKNENAEKIPCTWIPV